MIRFPELERLGVSVAAISEQSDGDCREPGPDTPREACLKALGIPPGDLVSARQVHGTAIAVVSDEERGRGARTWDSAIPATDGLVTAAPGLPLAVFVADCVPVFLYAPNARVGGLVHAGREGTLRNIAAVALNVMREAFDVPAQVLHAVIGPSAGPAQYEVSESLANEWERAGLPRRGRHLNLWEANRTQLEGCGVPEANITVAGMCTMSSGRFFSYRRGAASARNIAVIMI
jgi:YfiH family protein